MSLATRCTHCDTIFKVVQDQLKVSEGWVRCGRCNEVFNALEGLFDMEREAPPQRSRPTANASPALPSTPSAPAPGPEPEPEPTPASTWSSPAQRVEPTFEEPGSRTMPPAFVLRHPSVEPAADEPPTGSPTEPVPEPQARPPEAPPEPSADQHEVQRGPLRDEVDDPREVLQAVTHFDLDLPPSESAPPPATSTAAMLTSASANEPEALPVTDESDALDSRYLLTTEQIDRPRRRRRRRGPDFADAQFPHDLIEDSQTWDTDWALSDAPESLPHVGAEAEGHTEGSGQQHPSGGTMLNQAAQDTMPSTLPSRFADDDTYQPEQALPPPSKRKGRSGTRGRVVPPPAPEFIQQAERRAIWRHPLVRGVLSLMALALGVSLAGQAAHHWRDQLASEHPEFKPWLAKWCSLAGCKLSTPMRLDDLQVDNITLVKTESEGADAYRMTVIIHSKAEVPVAWPRVDITLTDPTGDVVARRAFDAHTAQMMSINGEATSTPRSAPAAVPPGASTTLQWQLRAPDLHLASYTAELFYP